VFGPICDLITGIARDTGLGKQVRSRRQGGSKVARDKCEREEEEVATQPRAWPVTTLDS
jgi:hypothetical protein